MSWAARASSGGGARVWRDRLSAARDALLASRRFQRWAAAFPLTRPVARRRTRALFDLCAGFVYSQVLATCVELRLFDLLAEGPERVDVLAERLDLPPESADRLLTAAAALGLVRPRSGGRFGLGPLGAAMLGNPAIEAMVRHHALLYADLRDPVTLLRGKAGRTQMGLYWPYAGEARRGALTAAEVVPYSTLMSLSQSLIAEEVLGAYPLREHRMLLDIGGGEGAFLAAAAAREPGLRLALFDLPAVAERARSRLALLGLDERVTVFAGDFFADPLPAGADVVSLIRVLHDHDDEAALRLLRAAREVLPDRGRILIGEPMASARSAGAAAYFSFYLLAMGQGRPRSPAEIGLLLEAAGFTDARLLATHTPLLAQVMVADCRF